MGTFTKAKAKAFTKTNKALSPDEFIKAINDTLKDTGPTDQYKAIEPLVTSNIAIAKELVGQEDYIRVNKLIWLILDVYNG